MFKARVHNVTSSTPFIIHFPFLTILNGDALLFAIRFDFAHASAATENKTYTYAS